MYSVEAYMWSGAGANLAENRQAIAFKVFDQSGTLRGFIATNGHRWQALRPDFSGWTGRFSSGNEALAIL